MNIMARVASVMIQSNTSHGLRMAALGFKKKPLARIWVKRGEDGRGGNGGVKCRIGKRGGEERKGGGKREGGMRGKKGGIGRKEG